VHLYVSNVEPDAVAPSGRLLFHSDLMWTNEPLTLLSLYGEAIQPGLPRRCLPARQPPMRTCPPPCRRS
jgi:taurine dioxygenase